MSWCTVVQQGDMVLRRSSFSSLLTVINKCLQYIYLGEVHNHCRTLSTAGYNLTIPQVCSQNNSLHQTIDAVGGLLIESGSDQQHYCDHEKRSSLLVLYHADCCPRSTPSDYFVPSSFTSTQASCQVGTASRFELFDSSSSSDYETNHPNP